ncbi:tyrosine-type recombinase/integrase [Amphritea sp.]|uniref:tyrosine-type recombinase/integrase n=1 Tax=Amphritea sp. TaxID=1872502 RepID=UPI003566D3AD
MSQANEAISPLRQRMIEDMNVRNFTPKTQVTHIRAVKKLASYLGHSPAKATAEDLRQFFVHLSNEGASPFVINATIYGLRFFFRYIVDKPEVIRRLKAVSVPSKVPVILTLDEVSRLLLAAKTAKFRAAFGLGYGAGLRIQEICHLKVKDIDSQRMAIRVEQGKGKKDRFAMLSNNLLLLLRAWWREGHARGRLYDSGWLFPGQNPVNPMTARHLSRVCLMAAKEAGITKHVTMHALRHSFATHLLEQKVDIRVIQVLLGHSKIQTTTRYTQVASSLLKEAQSPLDKLTLPE